jgi:hypothetical protein
MESTVYASYEDTVQHIRYFGGINCLFTQKGKTFTKDSRFTYKQNGLGMMLCFAQTKNLDVWFVTGRSWGWFNNKDTVVNSIKGTPMLGVSSVYADYKDNLWFGCSNGLFFYDHKHFTKVQHPELEYMVNAFHETQSGELLVGGRNGVSFLDLKSFYADGNLRIRFYGKEQGFTGEECGQNNILRDSQQRIWIATGTNLIMFKESDLQDNTNPPRLDMQQITTETDDGKFTVLGYGESVFTHHLENITFEFTGINLRDPSHVMYSCILENYDKQWSEFGFQNLAEYKKLRPGKYRFRVKTRNGYGLESKNELMYSFEIVPAFYQTIWFLVVVVLGLVFAIALIVTLISRSKRKRLVDAIRKEVAQKETESNLILERKNVEMKMVQLERKH